MSPVTRYHVWYPRKSTVPVVVASRTGTDLRPSHPTPRRSRQGGRVERASGRFAPPNWSGQGSFCNSLVSCDREGAPEMVADRRLAAMPGGDVSADLESVASLLSPRPPVSVGAALADRIVTAIAVGEFQPGQRLPSERDLAARLGLARSSVRDALAQGGAPGHARHPARDAAAAPTSRRDGRATSPRRSAQRWNRTGASWKRPSTCAG